MKSTSKSVDHRAYRVGNTGRLRYTKSRPCILNFAKDSFARESKGRCLEILVARSDSNRVISVLDGL